jgi:uncharacterized membrane protein
MVTLNLAIAAILFAAISFCYLYRSLRDTSGEPIVGGFCALFITGLVVLLSKFITDFLLFVMVVNPT